MQFLFLDSNLFLQCRPLQDLDWDSLVGNEELTLLVPSAVLTELDKHKSDGNSRRAQKARRALQFLNALLEAPGDAMIIRETPFKVIAKFAPEVFGNGITSNDDSILFEVVEMARACGNSAVGLVTHDTNLKVKAKRKGLRFFPVPNQWLLAPEPDERDKRLTQLEREVALLKKHTPIIEITLAGIQEIELIVPNYEPLSPGAVASLVEAMTAKFPMKTDFSLSTSERLFSSGFLSALRPPAEWEIAKYQKEEYPKWEQSLRDRLERFQDYLRFRDVTSNIRFLLANNGTVPAEHVHLSIRVSEGFLITELEAYDKLNERVFQSPGPPSPPLPQQTSFDSLANIHRLNTLTPPFMPVMPIIHARDEFYLKTGKNIDTEWVWACANMRHGVQHQEFAFRVGMKAQSQASGGQMVIDVSAENLPNAAVKQYRIKIVSVDGDTQRAANHWLGLSKA